MATTVFPAVVRLLEVSPPTRPSPGHVRLLVVAKPSLEVPSSTPDEFSSHETPPPSWLEQLLAGL